MCPPVFSGDFALELPHPHLFAVIEGFDDNPVRIEEQRVRPDNTPVLHVRAMDIHNTAVTEIDR